MESTMVTETQITTKNGLKARLYLIAEKMLRHNAMLAVMVIIAGICMAGLPEGSTIFDQQTIHAAGEEDKDKDKDKDKGDGDSSWNTTTEWLAKWVKRLGGVVIFLGVVEVGFGFVNDNPSAKTMGWKFVVGGAIIFAAGSSYDTFIV